MILTFFGAMLCLIGSEGEPWRFDPQTLCVMLIISGGMIASLSHIFRGRIDWVFYLWWAPLALIQDALDRFFGREPQY